MEKQSVRSSQDNIQKLILESEKYTKETSQFFKRNPSHSHPIPRSESLPVHILPQKPLNPLNDSQKQNNSKSKPPNILNHKPPNLIEMKEKEPSNKSKANKEPNKQVPVNSPADKPTNNNSGVLLTKKNLLKNCNIAINLNKKDLNSLNVATFDKASLQFINLSSNKFKRFPEELRQFPNLKSLKIDHNFIKTLPKWLSFSYKQIEILSFSDNLLQDMSFLDDEGLKNSLGVSLRFLDVSFNHIDYIPIQIQHLKELRSLRIHNNDFLSVPTSIRNIPNLQEFTLEWFKYIKCEENQSLTDSVFKSLKHRFSSHGVLSQEHFNALITDGRASRSFIEIMCVLFKNLETEEEKASCFLIDLVSFFQVGSEYTLDINKVYKESGQSLLHRAVLNEEISVIKSLIFYEFELLNHLDLRKNTALSLAIQEERYFAAKVLIYNGANVEIGGDFTGNCLNLATAKLQIFLIEDLLKFGANPNAKDTEGNSSLHYLSSIFSKDTDKASKIMTRLLESGANPNIRNHDLWSPIHLAVKRDQIAAINFMISWNKSLKSQTASQFLNKTSAEKTKVVKPFKVNKKGGVEKWTPLHIAVSISNYEIIQILLSNKVDIYAVNSNNYKPASYCRSAGVLKLLRIHEKKLINMLRFPAADILKRSFIQNTRNYDKNSDVDEEKSRVIENPLELEEEKAIKNLILGSNDINKIEKFNRFLQKPTISKNEVISSKDTRILRSKSSSELTNINKVQAFLQNFHSHYKNAQFSLAKYQKLVVEGFSHYPIADLIGYITAMKLLYYKLLGEISILEGNSITVENVQRFVNQKSERNEIFHAFKDSHFAVQRCFLEMMKEIATRFAGEVSEGGEKSKKFLILIENLINFFGKERKKGSSEEAYKLFLKEMSGKVKEIFQGTGKSSFLTFEAVFILKLTNSRERMLAFNGTIPVIRNVVRERKDMKVEKK